MPVLTEPTPRVHASFVEAVREYRAEGRYSRLDPAMLAESDQFERFLDRLRADASPGILRRRYRVPRRVIEANGGSLASASHGILRFWVPTAPRT